MFETMRLDGAARIQAAAFIALNQGFETALEPNYCLKFVRIVWEKANSFPDRSFYKLIVGESGNPSAAEVEDLLRQQRPRWGVADAQAGDFLFWHDLPMRWGHVGIGVKLGNEIWVAQNTTSSSGFGFTRHLRLIKLAYMPKPTSVFRIGEVL